MKAEHRKELQRNVLEDRMRGFMENVRQKPKGKTVLLWLLVIVALISVVVYVFWRNTSRRTHSELWLKLNTGGHQAIDEIIKEYPDYEQAKIGRFQKAWTFLWDTDLPTEKGDVIYSGIANIKTYPDPRVGLYYVEKAANKYKTLIEETKDDPILCAEAMYNLAIAREALAIHRIDNLKEAKSTLKKLVKDFPKTVHAKMAKKRLEVYDNDAAFKEMQKWYKDFHEEQDPLLDKN